LLIVFYLFYRSFLPLSLTDKFFFFSFIHTCIQCLGHFSSLPPPPPSPTPHPPSPHHPFAAGRKTDKFLCHLYTFFLSCDPSRGIDFSKNAQAPQFPVKYSFHAILSIRPMLDSFLCGNE
jgi:hypothetical protein